MPPHKSRLRRTLHRTMTPVWRVHIRRRWRMVRFSSLPSCPFPDTPLSDGYARLFVETLQHGCSFLCEKKKSAVAVSPRASHRRSGTSYKPLLGRRRASLYILEMPPHKSRLQCTLHRTMTPVWRVHIRRRWRMVRFSSLPSRPFPDTPLSDRHARPHAHDTSSGHKGAAPRGEKSPSV